MPFDVVVPPERAPRSQPPPYRPTWARRVLCYFGWHIYFPFASTGCRCACCGHQTDPEEMWAVLQAGAKALSERMARTAGRR